MTQENKDLLLKDLCARLPYGVFVETTCARQLTDFSGTIRTLRAGHIELFVDGDFSEIKPYLRSMDDMIEGEKHEYNTIAMHTIVTSKGFVHIEATELIDWLNSHHLDYRGLIEKGLAIEAPEGMYK